MRTLINWKDRQVEHPHRVTLVNNGDGTYDIQKSPGRIEEEGTPQKEANFNNMDLGIFEALMVAEEALRSSRLNEQEIGGLDAEIHEVTLNNGYVYPFNNSVVTVQLDKLRNKNSYTVNVEVESVTGDPGCSAGDVQIYDKLNNGFKVHFSGSAKTATVKLYVRGGF